VRKSDLLAELTGVMSGGVTQDLWILSIGIDNNPWGLYQPLIPITIGTKYTYTIHATLRTDTFGMYSYSCTPKRSRYS